MGIEKLLKLRGCGGEDDLRGERDSMLKVRVIGNATATVRHPSMRGWKLLLVQALAPDGKSPDGDPFLAMDTLGAGKGEMVIASNDRKGMRELLGVENSPLLWLIVGIVD